MTLDHREQLLQPARQALSALVHPVRMVASLPATLGEMVAYQFRSRRELMAEIERLRAQRLLNEVRLQKLDALEVENIRLRELLDSSYEVSESVLISELVGVELSANSHLIEIDKGSMSGVYPGQPVLDADGVVGQVDHVGPFSATVRLISDASHAIPVQVNRNGVRSVAIGTGNLHQLDITGLPNNTDIRVGDLLVTSGLGGRFPPGYPVARVSSVTTNPGLPFATVLAEPTGNIDRIQEVLLVRRDPQGPRLAGSLEDSATGAAAAADGEPSS
jgi:rod shape-determining protein MreC